VAIQTGSICISDSTTDITTIPTANLGFSTTASSQKVSTSDYNIERQPDIAIWPPKPEIVIPLELQQTASKFQRQVPDIQPCRARVKCHQVIATMTNNRKWQSGPKTRNTYIFGTMTDRMTIPTANLGFWTTPSAKTDPGQLRQRPTTGNGNTDFSGANLAMFGIVDRCRNHLANLLSSSSSSKSPNFALEFRRYLSDFHRCNCFRFWGHIDIFGCRSLLYSLANTIFHLHVS